MVSPLTDETLRHVCPTCREVAGTQCGEPGSWAPESKFLTTLQTAIIKLIIHKGRSVRCDTSLNLGTGYYKARNGCVALTRVVRKDGKMTPELEKVQETCVCLEEEE